MEDLLRLASEKAKASAFIPPRTLDQKCDNLEETSEQTNDGAATKSAVNCMEDDEGASAHLENHVVGHGYHETSEARPLYFSSSFPQGPESRWQVRSPDLILSLPRHQPQEDTPHPRETIRAHYTSAYLQKVFKDSETRGIFSEVQARPTVPSEHSGDSEASSRRGSNRQRSRRSYGSLYRDQGVQTGESSGADESFGDESSPLLQSKKKFSQDTDTEGAIIPKKTEASSSLCELLRRLAPIGLLMLLHGCSSAIHSSILTQYIYYRYAEEYDGNSTRQLPPGASQCQPNGSMQLTPEEERVQRSTNNLLMQMSWTCGFPAIIATILIGTYADQLGRRTILVAMLCGRLVRDAVVCAIVYWSLDVRYLMLAYVIDGFSGSFFSFYLATYAYTSDVSPDKRMRMIALTISSSSLGAAYAAVSYGAGYVIQDFGFLLSALLVVLTSILSLPIAVFWLKNTVRSQGFICIAPWKAVSKVYKFYVVAAPGRHRGLFWLGAGVFSLMVLDAMGGPDTLYMMAPPFCWDAEQIGLYAAIRDLSTYILSVVLVRLMQFCFRDESLALMGLLTTAARNVITGLASSSFMLYLAGASGLGSAMNFPVVRGLMSCMVEPDELGALFASLAVIEAAGYLGASTLSNKVYEATLEVMRGAVYFVKAGFNVIAFILMILLVSIVDRRRRASLTSRGNVQQ